jgi:CheY-like chemotaxis protein
MNKNILIIDKDKGFGLSLKEILAKVGSINSVWTAQDASTALQILEKNFVSLVIADLQICGINDFNLLVHISQSFPDIPVITVSAQDAPDMERLARDAGATDCIAKGYPSGKISEIINVILSKESDGGILHGVSSGMFLQIMEMEQKTGTIRVHGNSPRKRGVLFFCNGELLDARFGGLRTEPAAHIIFSWDDVSISIQKECPLAEKKMEGDLQAILLEAMRLKDEAATDDDLLEADFADETSIDLLPDVEKREKSSPPIISLQYMIQKELGARGELLDISHDGLWKNVTSELVKTGDFFGIGSLKGGYVDMEEENRFVLLLDETTKVFATSSLSSRDRIIQILSKQ